MKIETDKIKEGKYDGKSIWVCGYKRESIRKKATRIVEPVRVKVLNSQDWRIRLGVLPKEGSIAKKMKIINLRDNTAGWDNNYLMSFTTEAQCRKAWKEQVESSIEVLDELLEGEIHHWHADRSRLMATIS